MYLSYAEKRIYQEIIKYTTKYGYPPSFDDLKEHTGFRSKSSISHYIEMLQVKGLIETNGKSRAIKVVGYEYRRVADER